MATKAKAKKSTKAKQSKTTSTPVKTKGWSDVAHALDRVISYNIHDRHNMSLSDTAQHRVVSYGPWLAVGIWILVIPQLIALAKTGGFLSLSMLLETMVYSKESWVMLLLFFMTSVAAASSITELSLQKIKGWNKIYIAVIINLIYVIYQLVFAANQPAGSLLSTVALLFILFVLLDIRKFYSE